MPNDKAQMPNNSECKNQNGDFPIPSGQHFNLCSVILHFDFCILKMFDGGENLWAELNESRNYKNAQIETGNRI
jgi:hypothetical protein